VHILPRERGQKKVSTFPVTLALKQNSIPQLVFGTTSLSICGTEIIQKIRQKSLKGIDKRNMWFIIGLWGKVGKMGG
jgi:hypothetical protein